MHYHNSTIHINSMIYKIVPDFLLSAPPTVTHDSKFFLWSEWRVLFLYWHATAKSFSELINQTRHKTSSCITLFLTNYIFWCIYMWHIYRIMTYVSRRKRSHFFWKEDNIITPQHLTDFFPPCLLFFHFGEDPFSGKHSRGKHSRHI